MSEQIYLDHAATSWPKPQAVIERTIRSLTELTANAGRSAHRAAIESARVVFELRQAIARLLEVRDSADIAFVRGCTEGTNLVLRGWLDAGDCVAVSPMEHNAVMRPLRRLSQQIGVKLITLPADRWGRVDAVAAAEVVGDTPPRLVAVQHASNVNGVVQDIQSLRAAFPNSALLVDAAQTAGVLPLTVGRWRADFVTASLHKGLLGPTGVGFCYLAPHRQVRPLIEGGTGSRSESLDQPTFRPDCFESGTLNLHGIAGGLAALHGLPERGLLGEHKRELCTHLIEGLKTVSRVRLHAPDDGTAICVSFTLQGMQPDEVALRLERQFGILCRPGLHCSPAAHRHLGTFPGGSVRLSPGWGNTHEQIEATIAAIAALARES